MRFDIGSISRLGDLERERLSRYTRHLPVVASVVLVIAIAHALADMTWRVVPLNEGDAPQAVPTPEIDGAGSGGSNVDLERLTELSVFGDPDPQDAQGNTIDLSELDAPETQLNLELRGVIATEIPEMSRAIIASGRGEDESYEVGDSIGSGASLRAIYPDRVILERGGELETLRLPREDDDGLTRSARRNGSGSESDTTVTVPDEVADLRSQIQENPEKITDIVRPTPHHVDGEMVGFRIFPGRMREEFQQLGLQSGDIVTAINGQPMNSPAAGMSLLNDLQNASSVELTIERGGRETSVTISLGQ